MGVWNALILHQELGRKGDLWKPGEVGCTANPVSQDKRKCGSRRAKRGCELQMILHVIREKK